MRRLNNDRGYVYGSGIQFLQVRRTGHMSVRFLTSFLGNKYETRLFTSFLGYNHEPNLT